MNAASGRFARKAILAVAGLLSGCAPWYEGRGLEPGVATGADVLAVMGQPVAAYASPEGEILEYDRGYRRYMVHLGADDRLGRIEQVYTNESFGRVKAGMSAGEIQRMLGIPYRTARFDRRDETVWDYRFHDDIFNYVTYFHVVFDDAKGTVKSTLYTRDYPPSWRPMFKGGS